MGKEVFKDSLSCVKKKVELSENYNMTVDVVSAFECFFKKNYKNNVIYFDRFPVIGNNKLRPDFTVLFSEEYGLVGEICRSMPKNDEEFTGELKQLKKYDQELPFKKTDDEQLTPKNHDILLTLSTADSSEIVARIKRKIDAGEIEFERDLIFMEYVSRHEDRNPNYQLRKFPGHNNPFKNTSSTKKESLEYILGEENKSLRIPIKNLRNYKVVSGSICNDVPPEAYFSVVLWPIFYHYLKPDQQIQYKEKNDKKGLPIELRVGDFTRDLNSKYVPGAQIERKWVKNVFNFLIKAKYCTEKENGVYEIKYRNIVERLTIEREGYMKNGEGEREKVNLLNRHFIERYCNTLMGEMHERSKDVKLSDKKQISLEEVGFKLE